MNNLRHYITLVENQGSQETVLADFMTNLKSLLGHKAFFFIQRKRFLQVKTSPTSVSFMLPFGSNVHQHAMMKEDQIEDAFNKANTSGTILYVSYDEGRPPIDRQGKIAGPVPVRFTVSTQKLPNVDFTIGGNSIDSATVQQIKSLVPNESSNRYAYLKNIRNEGDQVVISYAYRMAGLGDRDHHSGAPSDEYDQKVLAGLNEYKALAQQLSDQFGINIVAKEVAW